MGVRSKGQVDKHMGALVVVRVKRRRMAKSPPLFLGGGQLNTTAQITRLVLAFWAAVGGGNSHRNAEYCCQVNCELGPFPYMVSRTFFPFA